MSETHRIGTRPNEAANNAADVTVRHGIVVPPHRRAHVRHFKELLAPADDAVFDVLLEGLRLHYENHPEAMEMTCAACNLWEAFA